MKELTLQVNYLIPFIWFNCKGCFKGFPLIKYTYVGCLKVCHVACLCLSWFDCFLVYCAITCSEPFQTTKMKFFVKIVTSKETSPLLRRFRSSHRRCSVKKVFLEISQNLQENTYARVSFSKKRLWHRCFPVNFPKFLRTPFLQNTSRRLLLTFKRVLNMPLLNVK